MSDTTSTPQDRGDDEELDTFVDEDFGHGDNTEDGHLTSAQRAEEDRQREAELADPDQSAMITPETVVDPSAGSRLDTSGAEGDVEGIGTEPAPGDRNEPV